MHCHRNPDIRAQAHAAGTEWRVEQFGFNPVAALPVGVALNDNFNAILANRKAA